MKDHKAVALNKLYQENFFVCEIELEEWCLSRTAVTGKKVTNVGALTLSWFRKSETEDMAVEDQFFLRMGLA